jgi:UPF0755 protein
MMMKLKHILTVVIILIIAMGLYRISSSLSVTQNATYKEITIPENSSTEEIASILYKNSIIKSKTYFLFEEKILHKDKKIQSGDFVIPEHISLSELSNILARYGKDANIVKITIPEGYSNEQIAQLLNKNNLAAGKDFLSKVQNWTGDSYWFLNGIPQNSHKLDGFLFPSTYFFDKNESSNQIINTMLDQFNVEISPYKSYIVQNNYNPRNLITIASLIEKEAQKDVDRPKISSVIYNRLNKGMPLQIDATILYVIGHKNTLYNKDLTVKSPYNTYINKGLPPSPICNPGIKSIKAAIYPDKTDYLYYVLDKQTDQHVFASTYKEHLANIKKYLNN